MVNVVLLGLGLALLAAALKTWRGRPGPARRLRRLAGCARRRLHDREGRCRRPRASSGLNPKNVALTVAAAAEIAAVGLPPDQQVGILLCLRPPRIHRGLLTPLTVSLALGAGSRALLDNLKGWMARNNAVIMTVLFVLIGAKLIGDVISGFA